MDKQGKKEAQNKAKLSKLSLQFDFKLTIKSHLRGISANKVIEFSVPSYNCTN